MRTLLTTLMLIAPLLPAQALAGPDLTIVDIDGDYDTKYDLVTLDVTIQNIGDTWITTPFYFDLFGIEDGDWDACGARLWEEVPITTGLAPGATKVVSVSFDPDYVANDAPVYFFVDVNDGVAEDDETNNEGIAFVIPAEPGEPRIATAIINRPNPWCLQAIVPWAIPAAADKFYAKMRIL